MSQPTVVIAEDEARILQALCFIVEREGGRSVGVGDGQAALDAVRREQPVLVVLDVMMPGLSGWEVCRRLRAEPATATLPIVKLTALGQQQHEQQALAVGATQYIRKPFDPRAMRELIVAHLAGSSKPSDGDAE